MKGKRFTDEQIIQILHEAQAGVSVAGICRNHNWPEQSFYSWKAKFGAMDVSEAKRLRELERESAELMKMMAEQAHSIPMLMHIMAQREHPFWPNVNTYSDRT